MTREEDWAGAVSGIEAWRGRLDGLVNNAGIIRRTGIMDTSRESFEAVMAVNLTGALLGLRVAAPAMVRAGGGTVVNIASNAAFAYHPDVADTASKWALRGLTRSAAMEFIDAAYSSPLRGDRSEHGGTPPPANLTLGRGSRAAWFRRRYSPRSCSGRWSCRPRWSGCRRDWPWRGPPRRGR